MKVNRLIYLLLEAGVLAAALVVPQAPAQGQVPAQPEAGKITTLIPTGSVLRAKNTLEAKKDMSVLWLDTIKTDRGGRARIRLGDGSVLNVGSQASMMVTKHDPGKQQTDLELIYGKVRADVSKISTPDGHFEIRTKVAVCGVVGTEEYLESNDLATTVIALGGGQVRVSSTDSRFPNVVMLNPGETVSVIAGRGAGTKRLASSQELLRAQQDTEGESGATVDPGASVAGRTFDAVITGKGLGSTQSVSFAQPGLTVKTRGSITDTEIPATITVGPDVPVGAYPLTINRPQGPAVAGFAVASPTAIQMAQNPGTSLIQLPPSRDLDVIRGAEIPLDASKARTPSGTQIVAYQWAVPNTPLAGSGANFSVDTSGLAPGSYNVQLTVVNDKGQVATQQYRLTVEAGAQPVEIVRDLASGYESLQPSAFLKNFDQERFRNYAGFAAAIEDSFRSKLESMRVFQRPVNCAVVEQQDQGVCQAEFQLQFTLKNQPSELLDSQGNPIPPGTPAPPNATLGKRILKGSEQDTIRFERGNAGWKVVDYAAVVSCPNGDTTTGVNVGSCVLALGTSSSPSFQLVNLQLFNTDLAIGGSVSGSFTVQPIGGFTNSVNFSGQGQIGNQSVTVQFSPNPSGPMSTVNFTVFGPTTAPSGINGPTQFTLVINGRDASGAVTATANATLTLQPDFSLSVTPPTTASAPAAVTQNSTLPVTVQVVGGTGFAGEVFIDFPNLPAGFSANPGNISAGGQGSFPIAISAVASPGPALITVRGTSSFGAIRTTTIFLNVTSDFTLSVSPASSPASPIATVIGGTVQINVKVMATSGFAGSVAIDFPNLPTGFSAAGGNVAAGATGTFNLTNNLQAASPVLQITVRGRFGTDVQTITIFVQVFLTPPIAPGGQHATAYAVEPAKLNPGEVVTGKILGKNLSSVTGLEVSGSGMKVDLLESLPTELHVRFTADRELQPGSRFITLRAGENQATKITVDVSPGKNFAGTSLVPAPKTGALPEPNRVDSIASDASALPDLVIDVQNFSMTPEHPKLGDTVVFHLTVRNSGAALAENAPIEFSIGGTSIRQREKITVAPGESESLDFEWMATGTGRLEPQATIDPEKQLKQITASGKTAALQAFELVNQQAVQNQDRTPATGDRFGMRQKGELRVELNGCTGFRLASGSEQSCGGSADLEVSSRGGTSLVIEAEGVRSLGATPVDQSDSASAGDMSSSSSLLPGCAYLVKTRHGLAIVRVLQARGIESLRNAPPAALRGPRIGGVGRESQVNASQPAVTLVLEWKTLPQ